MHYLKSHVLCKSLLCQGMVMCQEGVQGTHPSPSNCWRSRSTKTGGWLTLLLNKLLIYPSLYTTFICYIKKKKTWKVLQTQASSLEFTSLFFAFFPPHSTFYTLASLPDLRKFHSNIFLTVIVYVLSQIVSTLR